jgi:hypothetical protein
MIHWLRELDRVLRGDAVRPGAPGTEAFAVSAARLAGVSLLLGVAYGACMGVYALCDRASPEPRQLVADMAKVPALFLLTLAVTFPSLYVFNVLVGARLSLADLTRLMASSLAVLLAVLAGFGPVVAFFSVTTASYPFLLLLNVAVFTAAGAFGMAFLFRTLRRLEGLLSAPELAPAPEGPTEAATEPVPVVPEAGRAARGRAVFACWVTVFALVGGQMSWVLRPFLGSPDREFTWLRPRESSFFEAVARALRNLLS